MTIHMNTFNMNGCACVCGVLSVWPETVPSSQAKAPSMGRPCKQTWVEVRMITKVMMGRTLPSLYPPLLIPSFFFFTTVRSSPVHPNIFLSLRVLCLRPSISVSFAFCLWFSLSILLAPVLIPHTHTQPFRPSFYFLWNIFCFLFLFVVLLLSVH